MGTGKWQNLNHHRIKTGKLIAKKLSRWSGRRGADLSTGLRGRYAHFNYSFYNAFFFKQPTGQTPGRILIHDRSKYVKSSQTQPFGGGA